MRSPVKDCHGREEGLLQHVELKVDTNLGQILISHSWQRAVILEVITIQSTRTARILGRISCKTIGIRDVLMGAVQIGEIMNTVQMTHHRLSSEVVRLHILFLFHDA